MSLPVVLRPLANADIQQIHAELEAQGPGLGDKFLDRLQEALDRIEAMPEMYAEVWGTVRAARLRRFRHVVYYNASPGKERCSRRRGQVGVPGFIAPAAPFGKE